ncbi:MAG: LUD domain-containing protein [Chryseolinea sp.]
MESRERILAQLKIHQRTNNVLPPLVVPPAQPLNLVDKLVTILTGIGGQVAKVTSWSQIKSELLGMLGPDERAINLISELEFLQPTPLGKEPHLLENVRLAVLKGHFAVAENGAVWVTSDLMGDRALPFICERLALVVEEKDVVPSMYEAYERIGSASYEFGTFIAGPSKTADIEQSLVLGAHGPKSMTMFLLKTT